MIKVSKPQEPRPKKICETASRHGAARSVCKSFWQTRPFFERSGRSSSASTLYVHCPMAVPDGVGWTEKPSNVSDNACIALSALPWLPGDLPLLRGYGTMASQGGTSNAPSLTFKRQPNLAWAHLEALSPQNTGAPICSRLFRMNPSAKPRPKPAASRRSGESAKLRLERFCEAMNLLPISLCRISLWP